MREEQKHTMFRWIEELVAILVYIFNPLDKRLIFAKSPIITMLAFWLNDMADQSKSMKRSRQASASLD